MSKVTANVVRDIDLIDDSDRIEQQLEGSKADDSLDVIVDHEPLHSWLANLNSVGELVLLGATKEADKRFLVVKRSSDVTS